MKTPKELKEWRASMARGREWYITTGFDPVGFKGRPVHVPTFGNMDAMQESKDFDGLTYRERTVRNALQAAIRAVDRARTISVLSTLR